MINLLYCGNYKVFDGMLISLLSIVKYNKDTLNVFVMTMDLREINENYKALSQREIDYLQSVITAVNENSRVTLVDISDMFRENLKTSPNINTSYTPYTLVRLFADKVDNIPDKILYLDTDTVANGDIQPLFDTDVTDYEFAGVIDYLGKIFISPNYMNAGILLLNMRTIKQTGLFERAQAMCAQKKMWFPDQTALNRLVKKKLFVPTKYNEQRKLRSDTVIQHFCKSIRWIPFFHTINIKPWQVDKVREVYKIHAYDDILEDYKARMAELRKEAK